MNTHVALLKVFTAFAALVLSVILISIFSDVVWMLAQALGAGSAPVGFAIDLATALAVVRTVFGWAFSL